MTEPAPIADKSRRTWQEFSMAGAGLVSSDRLLGKCSTSFWSAWTKAWLRLLGHTYGPGLRVDGRLRIRAPRRGAIRLGRNVRLVSRFGANLVGLTQPMVLQCLGQGRIEIGDNSGMSGVVLSARSRIQIGQHVMVGGNVRIFDHDFHALDCQERQTGGLGRSQPVVIGDHVFVGTNAIILKGVSIGDRSVIGAGAVVSLKEIPPDSLVAGNPARIIRKLRSSDR